MFSKNHTLDSKQLIDKIFNIFIFQPDEKPEEGFYCLNFDEKINILSEKIIAAKEYIMSYDRILCTGVN